MIRVKGHHQNPQCSSSANDQLKEKEKKNDSHGSVLLILTSPKNEKKIYNKNVFSGPFQTNSLEL